MTNKQYTILIVDDEEDNLELMYRTLYPKFNVLSTTSPISALKLLSENPVDLIISDHMMPEMDGVEFLKKSLEINSTCVRLLVTAYSDSVILIDAINEAKIYRYIKKPWNPSEFLVIVEASVEYYQLLLENDKLIFDLKSLFSGTVNAIIDALDAKDSYTLGKSRRVTFLALKIGEYLGLAREQIGMLELAGLLHDIGMIGVPDTILLKTEVLDSNEYQVIKRHVEHGVKILEDIKQLSGVVEIIKSHHEKFDGSGYPDFLKGEEIPLCSRIIAIADAYDSIVSDRAYREGVSHEVAIDIIASQSGIHFDPMVVEAFIKVIPSVAKEFNNSVLN